MTIVYLSLFCLLINNNSTVVPNALSQVTHTRSGEKLKKKCFSGKTGDKPRASLRRQLNGRVTYTCKLFHYNEMCSRTFKTVINNNIKKVNKLTVTSILIERHLVKVEDINTLYPSLPSLMSMYQKKYIGQNIVVKKKTGHNE